MRHPLETLFMTLFSSFFCLAIEADDANNLVAHYTFDEGSGDVLHDRSGNGHDGKIVGSEWALQEGFVPCGFGAEATSWALAMTST